METFPLTMGKQIGDDDDNFDLRRFSGKFKVTMFSLISFGRLLVTF